MPDTTNPEPLRGFDAVAESRKWKEAVARETAGMSMAERSAYFRRHSSVASIRAKSTPAAIAAPETCSLREGLPKT